jgi:PAS domain S-box-containing protein
MLFSSEVNLLQERVMQTAAQNFSYPGYFSGGGDVAALMRDANWANTLLGAPACWPQGLCAAVSLCLNSAYPLLICWGPDLALLYNDSGREAMGGADEAWLGQPLAEVLPELWKNLAPAVERVLNSGEPATASCHIGTNRGSRKLDLRISPIPAAKGFGGVFCSIVVAEACDDQRRRERPWEAGWRPDMGSRAAGLAPNRLEPVVSGDAQAEQTSRRVAEEQENLFLFLAEQCDKFIAIWNLDRSLSFLNPAGLRILGLKSLDEAKNIPLEEFFFPEDRPLVRSEFGPRAGGEVRSETEIRFRNIETGEPVWMQHSVFTLTGRDGAPAAYASIDREIGDQKRAQHRLIEAERRLQAVMRAAPIGIGYSNDPECEVVFGNPTLHSQLEIGNSDEAISSPAEEAGRKSIRYFKDGRELAFSELPMPRAVAQNGEIASEEIEVLLPSGRRWCAEISASPIRGEEGLPVGAVAVVADRTQRKHDAEALRENEELFRALAELNPDAIMVLLEGRYVYANQAAARLFGAASGDEILGLTPFDIIDPVYHDLVVERMRSVLEESRVEPLMDHRWRKLNGTPVDVETATGPIRWRGRPAVQVVARDVTERNRVLQALRDADRQKDEFLATLAHELRNPLAPISNAMHVMRKADDMHALTVERKRALLAMMERQTFHLVRLVDDLLEISRISRGKILLRKEAVDLASVLRDAIDTSRPLIDSAGLVLQVRLPPEAMLLDADPTRLTQVFANLLNNAAKYTEAGGLIELIAERRGEEAVVSVRDNGAGVPPEMLSRLFEIFTQVDSTLGRAQGGLGIGLALARKLVQLHGGEIEAYSDGPGRGSEFIVRFPLCNVFERESMSNKVMPKDSRSPRRVLVIDDDHDVADSLVLLLETFGATACAAYSGAEGLELIPKFKPELVFLDLGMPRMNGYETAARIRESAEGRALNLVALSGWGQEEDVARSRQAGFDDHFTKPADIEALEELLQRLDAA